MSEKQAVAMTKVVGYFNAQKFPIFIEISEINLKAELAPNAYIRDRNGRYINDPIFEPYCHQRGLSRAIGKEEVPINYVPRFVKIERPPATVTQATGFVRQSDGRTVPTYSAPPQAPKVSAANKNPVHQMTVEQARKAGLIGRPRLVSEDYGIDETTGAPPKGAALPGIKYSLESAPKIKSSSTLNPELLEATDDLTPEQQAERKRLQATLAQTASQPTADAFNPARVAPKPTAVALTPEPAEPVQPVQPVTPVEPVRPVEPVTPRAKTKSAVRVAPQQANRRRVAAPVKVEPTPPPVQEAAEDHAQEVTAEIEEIEPGSGIVQPLDDVSLPAPNLDEPAPAEDGKRFICAADGQAFQYRSQLDRHVKRNYPQMYDELMAPYPPH
jgi:hypothetical protein